MVPQAAQLPEFKKPTESYVSPAKQRVKTQSATSCLIAKAQSTNRTVTSFDDSSECLDSYTPLVNY